MPVKGSQTKFGFSTSDLSDDDMDTAVSSDDLSGITDLAKVTDIKPPKVETDDIDVSHMDSPEQHKQFAAGWANGGEVEVTVQFEKARNAAIYGAFRKNRVFRVTFFDGSTWGFKGYIKSFGNEVEREKIVTATVTCKVSGKPLFTPAADPG